MQTYLAIVSLALAGFSYGSPTSATNRRFVHGQCGIHVTQWQKNENGVGSAYQFDVVVKDAIGDTITSASRLAIADYSSATVGGGGLPYFVVITAGSVDSDPVQFAYAGHRFSSSNGCRTGRYDSGNRDMDCGFAC